MDNKINNLISSADIYFYLNNAYIVGFLKLCEKVIKDKNYNIIFDKNVEEKKVPSINALIRNKDKEVEIKINPYSQVWGEIILIHEITHVIETKKMKRLVLDYASKHADFKQALDDLKVTYKKDGIASELLANISGELFGNKEFINNLSLKKPTIFKKIYNSIISLANKITGNSYEALFVRDLKNKWEAAYRNTTKDQAVNNLKNQNSYSLETTKDGTTYVKTENGLFTKNDGTPMTQREIFNSLVGKKITFDDGIEATIVNRLTSKDMYNELFRRYPTYQNVTNIKSTNSNINENIFELLENSKNISPNEPDYMQRHKKQEISTFDTRQVSFYDGTKAYDLAFSIAKLNDGTYVAYAKRNLSANNNLTSKIKEEMPTSKSRLTSLSNDNITQSKENVKLPN